MCQWVLRSYQEMMQFSEEIAAYLQADDVLTLSGELGAGKTIFTKGLAKGLGIRETVNSPTFTIIKEYTGGRLPLYHMDVYRISDEEDIGLEDYYGRGGIIVIEWAENIPSWLPNDYLAMKIVRLDENDRAVSMRSYGPRSERLYREIIEHVHTGN